MAKISSVRNRTKKAREQWHVVADVGLTSLLFFLFCYDSCTIIISFKKWLTLISAELDAAARHRVVYVAVALGCNS